MEVQEVEVQEVVEPGVQEVVEPGVQEEVEVVETEVVLPETFKVEVYNDTNGVTGLLFERSCDYDKKTTMMKSTRQSIRNLGASITKGEVYTSADLSLMTITFTDLVIVKTVKDPAKKAASTARANADDTVATEMDIEVLGIVHGEETAEAKAEMLKAYKRNILIHAFNMDTADDEDVDKLTHYSTQATAIEKLLAV